MQRLHFEVQDLARLPQYLYSRICDFNRRYLRPVLKHQKRIQTIAKFQLQHRFFRVIGPRIHPDKVRSRKCSLG